METPDHVRIRFDLEQDEDGWPPGSVEWLWARRRGDGYLIENIPLFVEGVALHDVVSAEASSGQLAFSGVRLRGGHSTVCVFLDAESAEATRAFRDVLRTRFGIESEDSRETEGLVAIDVPANVSLRAVREFLEEQQHEGTLEYWMPTVSPQHKQEFNE